MTYALCTAATCRDGSRQLTRQGAAAPAAMWGVRQPARCCIHQSAPITNRLRQPLSLTAAATLEHVPTAFHLRRSRDLPVSLSIPNPARRRRAPMPVPAARGRPPLPRPWGCPGPPSKRPCMQACSDRTAGRVDSLRWGGWGAAPLLCPPSRPNLPPCKCRDGLCGFSILTVSCDSKYNNA